MNERETIIRSRERNNSPPFSEDRRKSNFHREVEMSHEGKTLNQNSFAQSMINEF